MADDGRTFFSSKDQLDPRDKDGTITDVYEYVDGRPQLITTGQANRDFTGGSEVFSLISTSAYVGLEAVSHTGVDVYFSTFETLVNRDHNGEYVKFYDARTGGGFPEEPELLPCEAADECHGADSSAPPPPAINSAGNLGASREHPGPAQEQGESQEAETEAAPIEEAAPSPVQRREQGGFVMRRGRFTVLMAAVAALLAFAAVAAGSAQAEYEHVEPGFDKFEVVPSTSQAGGHPDVKIDYEVRQDATFGVPEVCETECLAARRTGVHWPEGFIGNPHVAPKCTLTEFSIASCPSDSQIGYFNLSFGEQGLFVPLYNMETNPEQAGLLGFNAPLISFPVFLELSGRTESDYGLDAISTPTVRLPFVHFRLVLWGVPASEDNAARRFVTPMTGSGFCFEQPGKEGCPAGDPFGSETFAKATVPPAPFLQNPTTCGVPLTVTGEIEYYGGRVGKETIPWPETTSCNQASFSPSVTAKPTTGAADTPSGMDADLKVPQTQSPITPSPSELKSAKVTLPEGFSLNPNAADGKLACPDLLSSIGTRLPANCPEFSKIGTLTLDVAALPAPLPGALYLAEPKPGEPYRVLLAASGFATNVKLLGTAETDPVTGQVSLAFKSLPQSPLQEFGLHIFGSERGLLATPTHCGTFKVESEFVPWNTALEVRHTTNLITIDQGPGGSPCPNGARPLSPQLEAGVADPTAGVHSPFTLVLRRNDGEQNLAGVTVTTPRGFAATLAGVPYCPESAIATLQATGYSGRTEQAAPACPAASQIGAAVAGVGAGYPPSLHARDGLPRRSI